MLTEDAKLFLRAMFRDLPPDDDATMKAVAKGGRETIIMAIETFVDQFVEAIKSPKMDADAANIRANMDEAVIYVGGMLGMM